MNPEILTFLVRGRKISMPDRSERGLSPDPPIPLPEVEHHLAGILGHERRFPHGWHDHKQGQAIHEGGEREEGAFKMVFIVLTSMVGG
jgi:hypothetical protein